MQFEVKSMDIKRKRELLEAYKNRHPEMGVISFHCGATGESFFQIGGAPTWTHRSRPRPTSLSGPRCGKPTAKSWVPPASLRAGTRL